jgi:16S rRNA (guanine(966)-N(2))-methyltransferase RsmD
MRVIAGKYRRLLLKAPLGLNTRPSLDQVKEATFSILGDKIIDATCLDLFSGSGSLGIEALSRGAKTAHFNDFSKDAINVIKGNLQSTKVTEPYTVTMMDYKVLLNTITTKFDVIFVDPPYKDLVVEDVILKMEEKQLLNPYCVFVCETDQTSPHIVVEGYKIKEYQYGRVRLTVLKREK